MAKPACKRVARFFQKRCICKRWVYLPGFAIYITLTSKPCSSAVTISCCLLPAWVRPCGAATFSATDDIKFRLLARHRFTRYRRMSTLALIRRFQRYEQGSTCVFFVYATAKTSRHSKWKRMMGMLAGSLAAKASTSYRAGSLMVNRLPDTDTQPRVAASRLGLRAGQRQR